MSAGEPGPCECTAAVLAAYAEARYAEDDTLRGHTDGCLRCQRALLEAGLSRVAAWREDDVAHYAAGRAPAEVVARVEARRADPEFAARLDAVRDEMRLPDAEWDWEAAPARRSWLRLVWLPALATASAALLIGLWPRDESPGVAEGPPPVVRGEHTTAEVIVGDRACHPPSTADAPPCRWQATGEGLWVQYYRTEGAPTRNAVVLSRDATGDVRVLFPEKADAPGWQTAPVPVTVGRQSPDCRDDMCVLARLKSGVPPLSSGLPPGRFDVLVVFTPKPSAEQTPADLWASALAINDSSVRQKFILEVVP
ncbi:MAG: hypothetical protein KC620_01055 [Myxococcales bacterium]|nr:hypothetical protein [Myxococcales bacterium]